MSSKVFKALILGAPASGKGTISSRIVKTFNIEHISSGDKLRLHIKNQTSLGKEAETFIKNGQLVPDPTMIKFIKNEINQIGERSWLLDGFPRTLQQAESLWAEKKVDVALNLIVPFEIIINRVKGRWVHIPSGRVYNDDFNAPKVPGRDDATGDILIQREDDKPEVVRKRLEAYEELTRPVIEYYQKLGILQEFRGNTSDEIWPKVLKFLNSYKPHL